MKGLWHRKEIIGAVCVAAIAFGIVALSIHGMLPGFAELKAQRAVIEAYVASMPFAAPILYGCVYLLAVALSLPIATALTIFAGFLFGAVLGTVVVIVAATLGAVLLFFAARYFFRDYFQERFGHRIAGINEELTRAGFRDILLLRLAPVVPFSLINIAAALTSVRLRDYALATLVGIAPFTYVYVLAGTRLSEINGVGDVISPKTLVVISLVVLAAFVPIVIRRRYSRRRASFVE